MQRRGRTEDGSRRGAPTRLRPGFRPCRGRACRAVGPRRRAGCRRCWVSSRRACRGCWGRRGRLQRSSACGNGISGGNTSERDTTYDARRATTSAGEKPTSPKRARMLSTVSNGSGTVRSGAGAVGAGLPSRNSRRGAPGQLLTPMAPANWMLDLVMSYEVTLRNVMQTYKSPGVMLCCATKGFWTSTISSMPPLAWKRVSTSLKAMREPSAPPPPNLP